MRRAAKKERTSIESLRALTNLLAVLAGIIAVAGLTVVAIELLNSEEKSEAAIAITTAAFGIISTVITAYLGIKATANAAGRAEGETSEEAEAAVLARYEEKIKKKKVDRINEELDKGEKEGEIRPEVAERLRKASVAAEEEARRTDAPGGEG